MRPDAAPLAPGSTVGILGGGQLGRMLALGETGALKIKGPGPGMRDYQVRRSNE